LFFHPLPTYHHHHHHHHHHVVFVVITFIIIIVVVIDAIIIIIIILLLLLIIIIIIKELYVQPSCAGIPKLSRPQLSPEPSSSPCAPGSPGWLCSALPAITNTLL
jgi:hypothetical protein